MVKANIVNISLEELKKMPEEDKIISSLIKTGITLMNPGKVIPDGSLEDGTLLMSLVSYKQLQLPKDCSICPHLTDPYNDIAYSYIIRNDKIISTLESKYYMSYNMAEALSIIKKICSLNEGHIKYQKRDCNYKIISDLAIDEIKLPDGLQYKIIYFPSEPCNAILENGETIHYESDNMIQCKIKSKDDIVFPGILECLYKKDIKQRKKQ